MIKLSYDLHIHSCLSPCADDDMTPANIAGMAYVKGLDVIALTDHCSARNCPALMQAAKEYGITVIPGMEVCTSEEIHVVCLFPDLKSALDASADVYAHLPNITGGKGLFGNQLVMDEFDNVIESVKRPLWLPTTISFSELFALVEDSLGVFIPAHIDRPSASVLSQLGFVPPGSRFTCTEVGDVSNLPLLLAKHDYLRGCNIISSSDAHSLWQMNEAVNHIEAESRKLPDIFNALTNRSQPKK
ncbi:MAG: PHP domain-containing protein [Clostridiales bacterium]|nr:PHP domain-containing protein [Clostridiales bacterium]